MGEVTRLLECARDGDDDAWSRVVTLLYPELLQIARRVRGGSRDPTLTPTALVNECYLRLAPNGADAVENRNHMLALAGRAMRQILVNHARDRVAGKRGGGAQRVTFDEDALATEAEAADVLSLDSALAELDAQDARLARVVECRVFAGMSEPETAAALELPLRSVQRYWHDARTQLRALMSA